MRFFKNDNYIEDKIKHLINNNFDCIILLYKKTNYTRLV